MTSPEHHVERGIGAFAMVPEWILFALDGQPSPISASAIHLYAVLDRHEGPGQVYPSVARLSRLTAQSARNVQLLLAELESVGAVVIVPRYREDGTQRSNRYVLPFRHPDKDDRGGRRLVHPHPEGAFTPLTRTPVNENRDPNGSLLPETPVSTNKAAGPLRSKLTIDDMQTLTQEYSGRLGNPQAAIDAARGHRGFGFAVDQAGFVRRWLERDVESQAKRGPQRPAQRGGTTRAAATSSDSQRYPSAASGRFFDV